VAGLRGEIEASKGQLREVFTPDELRLLVSDAHKAGHSPPEIYGPTGNGTGTGSLPGGGTAFIIGQNAGGGGIGSDATAHATTSVNDPAPNDKCLNAMILGVIQNMIEASEVDTFSGGGAITFHPDPVPLVAPIPSRAPYTTASPEPDGNGVTLLDYYDRPSDKLSVTNKGQNLTHVKYHRKYRTYITFECPLGSYQSLAYFEWTVDFDSDITLVDGVPTSAGSETVGITAGPLPGSSGPAPVTGGTSANQSSNDPGNYVQSGF
jgi:hypothetical protein